MKPGFNCCLTSIRHARQFVRLPTAQNEWRVFGQNLSVDYATHLFIHGFEDKATSVCKNFQDMSKNNERFFDNLGPALKKATFTVMESDPSRLDEFIAFCKENFKISTPWAVYTGELEYFLEKGQYNEAFQLAAKRSQEINGSFGQYELLKNCFKRNDIQMAQKVYLMVAEKHGKNSALMDLAFAMLMNGDDQLDAGGRRLLETNGLFITGKKLQYLTSLIKQEDKYNVLRTMLLASIKNKSSSLKDIFNPLKELMSYYYNSKNFKELKSLKSDLKEVNYVFPTEISVAFKRALNG